MPNVKLPTGVDLYYESHGQGEPLIFVPSTAYSGEVCRNSNRTSTIATHSAGGATGRDSCRFSSARTARGARQIPWIIGAPIEEVVRLPRHEQFG